MADVPKHTTTVITRHEWKVGDDKEPTSIARVLRDGLFFAQKDMENLGVSTENDDAFEWYASDGGSIIIYVDIDADGDQVHR